VRQLLDEGLPGGRVVQIGLADFANSAHYAAVARDYGLTPFTRDDVRRLGPEMIAEAALEIAGAHGGPIYLDVDLDVCDRAEVPGCPAAVPGGLSADELRRLVRRLARDTRVHIIDLTELDVALDDGERTTRLAALCVLDALAGRIS
jgi:formiminoglutamase